MSNATLQYHEAEIVRNQLLEDFCIENNKNIEEVKRQLQSKLEDYEDLRIHLCKKTNFGYTSYFLRDFYYTKRNDSTISIRNSNWKPIQEAISKLITPGDRIGRRAFSTSTILISKYDKDSDSPLEYESICQEYILDYYEVRVIDDSVDSLLNHEQQCIVYVTEKLLLHDVCGLALFQTWIVENLHLLFLNKNIHFHIDKGLRDAKNEYNIVTVLGCLNLIAKWKEINYDKLLSAQRAFKENTDDGFAISENIADTLRKISIDQFSLIIKSLNKVTNTLRESRNKKSFDIMHGITTMRNVLDLKPFKINSIYNAIENYDYGTDYDFFCVLGYQAYLQEKEQIEMLRYFYQFGKSLKKANKYRIFSIPGKKHKTKGWISNLSSQENGLLYKYMLLNTHLGVDTYLLIYDQKKSQELGILYEQDYILRIPKILEADRLDKQYGLSALRNKIGYLESHTDFLTCHHSESGNKPNDAHSKLYFSYPEDFFKVNQVLSLDCQHKSYLSFIFADFSMRVFGDIQGNNIDSFEITSCNAELENIDTKLKLNNSKLRESTLKYFKENLGFRLD